MNEQKEALSLIQKIILHLRGLAKRPSDLISMQTFSLLRDLFVMVGENKQSEIGLGDNLQTMEVQRQFIDTLIHSLLCTNTYEAFKQSEMAKRSAVNILIESKQYKFEGKKSINSNSNVRSADKNLYEVCYDMTLSLMLSLCENEDGEVNYEISSVVLQGFVRHLRMHMNQNRRKISCLQSVLALNRLLETSKNLTSIAKDKDLLNFMFGLFPNIFSEQSSTQSSRQFNLNSLVIGQGLQGTQGYQQLGNQGQGAELQSAKSSAAQHQPGLSPMHIINSRNEEEKRSGADSRDTFSRKRLSFNKASSEPPSGSKVHDVGPDDKGGEEIEAFQSRDTRSKIVPPILMSKIESQQQQSSNSNSVMNNYFNIPLSQFNPKNISRGFKLGYLPQNTIAQSRLTRRQMSMSRKHTQKLSSVTNFAQLGYGEETSKTRDARQDFSSQERAAESQNQSTSQARRAPPVPKLNINSIVTDSTPMQRFDHLNMHTASHQGQITQNKSSNRSPKVSSNSNINFENQIAIVQSRMNNNIIGNYQTNTNVIKQQVNESDDHNASMYDEVNGSFIDDIGECQNPYIYDNAEEKLCQLAVQLGESCLTNDLAALISQKRDIELMKSARKTAKGGARAGKMSGLQKSKTLGIKNMQRSISVSYQSDNIFHKNESEINISNVKREVMPMDQREATRLIIINIAYQLLKCYDIDETRFLKHPIASLNAYISSTGFLNKQNQKMIQQIENLGDRPLKGRKIIISCTGKTTDNVNSLNMASPALTTIQLQQITEANQSDLEEIKESDCLDQSSPPSSRRQINRSQNDEYDARLLDLIVSASHSSIDEEERLIFKLFNKFAFVNEDILRKQVMNEIANFAAKEQGFDVKLFNTITSVKMNANGSFTQGFMMMNNLMAQQTPLKLNNQMSFDDAEDDLYFRKERSTDALQTLANPNAIWMPNGIAYDLNCSQASKSTAATMVSKEKIRKRLDVFLYSMDRRMKLLIQQYYEKTSFTFAEELRKELVSLNCYIKEQSSRIMLHQIIEVNIESLLMVKKILIDLSLKTNIFVMDFSKQIGNADIVFSGGIKIKTPQNGQNLSYHKNCILIENQRTHRELFSEYLKLLSIILKMTQTSDTMKLVNEIFVFDDQWLESVKTYSISLFLSDVVSTISISDSMNTQAVSLAIEELRGVNLINFIEPEFFSQIIATQSLDLYNQAKTVIQHLLLCSFSLMKYFKSVIYFYEKSISQWFSPFQTNKKSRHPASGAPDGANQIKETKMEKKQAQPNLEEAGTDNKVQASQKYWKNSIRKVLYQYMYLITPPNGLFSQYIQTNSINYINLTQTNQASRLTQSPSRRRRDTMGEATSFRQGETPYNLKLTKSILNFTHLMFNLPDKFTKYVFIDELMLFYIRTHYISFVRLYNKNFSKKDEALSKSKEASLTLCKKHLLCLFGIAKNRNEDTRRKLYQFKIVQFLTQEIELEFDIHERRKKFIQISKEEETKAHQEEAKFSVEERNMQLQNAVKPKIPGLTKLNLSGVAGASIYSGVDANQQEAQKAIQEGKQKQGQQSQQQKEEIPQSQKKGLPPGLTKLNIAGLGLSELKQDENQEQQNSQPQNTEKPKLGFKIPSLKIDGLGLSELKKDDADAKQEIQQQAPLPQKKPMIPSLKIAGLGLSEIIPDNNNKVEQPPQPQKDVQPQTNQQKAPSFKIPALKIQGLGLSDLTPDGQPPSQNLDQPQPQQQQEPPKKPMGFAIPKLNITGLGLSEITQSNDQNQSQPPPPPQQEAAVKKPTLPKLNIEGLGLSELQQNSITMVKAAPETAEVNKTIDYGQMGKEELFKKNEEPFDKTAPIKFSEQSKTQEEEKENKQARDKSVLKAGQDQKKLLESIESAQYITTKNIEHGIIMHIPEEQLDSKQKQQLLKNRIKVISNIKRPSQSQSKRSDYEDQTNKSLFEKSRFRDKTTDQQRESAMQIESVFGNDSNINTPKVYPKELIIQSEQKQNMNSSALSNDKLEGKPGGANSLFVPSNFVQTPQGNSSRSSQGSLVGRNKVFVPFLKLPENTGQDQSERVKHQKPDDNRFKLMKTKDQATPEIQRNLSSHQGTEPQQETSVTKQKGFGKKGKLLDIGSNTSQKNDSSNSNEPKAKFFSFQKEDDKQSNVMNKIPKPEPKKEELKQNNPALPQQTIPTPNLDKNKIPADLDLPQLPPLKEDPILQPKPNELLSQEMFYLKERSARPIYQDEDLHVLMLSLMVCLLLKPERGILDDLYCSQYPIMNGKQNILYLLHYHFNHTENYQIVEKVLRKVQEINPPLSGQRLLKLLCGSLFDLTLYNNGRDWKKIAEGAYAKVYEGSTNLTAPQVVAVKRMLFPPSIYERCTLHDIFTEITCLEELRLEPCVTDLYDYGVDSECYYIVQKRYACSLRDWRLQQKQQGKSLNENLSLYLSVYREFLKSLQTIHSHHVTHYDIKCDNVLIDFSNSNGGQGLQKVVGLSDEDRLRLALADFGECKIFSDDRDELDQRARGMEYCRPPEMLQLNYNTRKDLDKYDRRKQVGTNRLSDIWSAGCLFFELLTGEYLFYDPNYSLFLQRVTKSSEPLFQPDKLEMINNNIYLIDFMKYILVRDPRLRPSIDNVVKRFEHVFALLVSTTAQASANNRFSLFGIQAHNDLSGKKQNSLEALLDQTQLIMMQNSIVFGGEIKEETSLNQKLNHSLQEDKSKKLHGSDFMRIMEDVFLASEEWIRLNKKTAVKMGITHVVIEERFSSQSLRDKFNTLEVPETCDILQINQHELVNNQMNPFTMATYQGVTDFLRRVALQKGRVVFVESPDQKGEIKLKNGLKQRLMRECLLICLNHIFQINAYETYTLIRSQNQFFRISSQRLALISKWSQLSQKVHSYMQTYPTFSCICGSCVIILKRQFATYQSMQTVNCNCRQHYKTVETSQCPSPGCYEFILYLKTYFKSLYGPGNPKSHPLESLAWGFLEEEDFVLGPNYLGNLHQNSIQNRMIVANLSQTIDKNSSFVSIIEKKNNNARGGGGLKEALDFNLISKSSATIKNYAYSRWKLFKCKECHVWTHAVNELENRYALLLNNRVKDPTSQASGLQSLNQRSSQVNIGILNEQQIGNSGVRVPILSKIKLSLPF